MGSTNRDAEVLADRPVQDEENNHSSNTGAQIPITEKDEPEPEFDTGLNTWLQVLGSFFLFFNSWYGFPHSIRTCWIN